MTALYCCANGHRFAPGERPGGGTVSCPVCGVPVEPTLLSETAALEADAPTATFGPEKTAAAVPVGPAGYEILRVLGEGGMGVVYLARQRGFNRLVALKMIRAGGQASDRDRQRFQTEAESIARLTHAHIVQVYEVGEHQGQPFFSMEYCGGGSLRDRLREHPLSAADAARIVRQLAEAMVVAHKAGVLHRDLKPANVLLTEEGTPRIADFGLAKKLDDAGQTVPGAILGTPSYMAPEQARGSADLTAAVDVYALGAVLYECLTGRPPFKAATLWETVTQVLHSEVVSPRQLNSKVPLDLETICLKCLHKEPTRRYATAAELAADLGRFLAGEPIAARPVGALERAAKWVWRNPTVAALSAAVVVLLLGGMTTATTLALLAWKRADALAAANVDLEKKTIEIGQQKDEVARKNERLRRTLIEAWYGPIGHAEPRIPGLPVPLAPAEVDSLQKIAQHREAGLGEALVRIALEEPPRTVQLFKRADYLLHAGVGLDEGEREAVERLLVAELNRPGRTENERTEFALALVRLGGLSDAGRAAASTYLVRAMTRWGSLAGLLQMRATFSPLVLPSSPEQIREQVALLRSVMGGPDEPGVRSFQGEVLLFLAERLPPDEARPLYPLVVRAVLRQSLEGDRPLPLAGHPVIGRALPHLTDAEVAEAGDLLTAALTRWREGRSTIDLRSFGSLVRTVLPRLAPPARDELAAKLVARVVAVRDGSALGDLAYLLRDVAPTVSESAARRLVEAFRDRLVVDTELYQVGNRVLGLRALLERLDRAARLELEPVFLPKLVALPLGPDLLVRREVGRCIVLLVEGLPAAEASRRVVALVEKLPPATFRPVDFPPGLATLFAPFLPPEEAAKLAERMLADPDAAGVHSSSREVLALLPRLPPGERLTLAEAARKQLAAAPSAAATIPSLAVAVALLEASDPAVAAPRWDGLAREAFRKWMALTNYQLTLGDHGECQRLLARFPHAERAWLVRQMAEALDPTRPTLPSRTLQFLGHVGRLASTLAPHEAETAANLLLAAHIAEPLGASLPTEVSPCWEALAPCLSPAANARLADLWLGHLEPRPKGIAPASLEVLALQVRHSGPDRRALATRATAFLRKAIQVATAYSTRYTLVRHLAIHLAFRDEADAREIAEETLPLLHQGIAASQAGGYDRRVLSFAILRLVPFLDPDRRQAELGSLLDRLAVTIQKAGDRAQFDEPSYLLPAVAPLLSADQAAALARDVCRSGLDADQTVPLLRALLAGLPRPESPRAVAGLIGGAVAGAPYLGLLQAAPPLRVPDAALLAILAEPLCVGEPRRAVLEALEARHGRAFVDHWDAARSLRRATRR